MNQERWTAVDQYITDTIAPSDSLLDAALQASDEAGLPAMHVTPGQGKFLQLLARMQQAQRILEVGTLAGYSTIWMARALPKGGRLVTLELDPKHAAVARSNFVHAGLIDKIDLQIGAAADILASLASDHVPPFDLIFIDADKASSANYFNAALKLSRRGTVIIADNVVRAGAVIDAASTDASVQGVRHFYAAVAAEPRVSATALQTVGAKGYDGFAVVVVIAD